MIEFEMKGHKCFIDDVDADLLQWKWYDERRGRLFYICRFDTATRKNIKIHRVIMARMLKRTLAKGECVDHIDGNTLNNCRSNLRVATFSQNNANKGVSKNNKLGVKGVRFTRGKYEAHITVDKRWHYLGRFDTPEEAHAAYLDAAKEHFGDFAKGK